MAQGEGQQGNERNEVQDPASVWRSRIWPWIALVLVIMIVLLCFWFFWRQPRQSSMELPTETTQTPVVAPGPRPGPTQDYTDGPSQSTSGRLVPNVLGDPRATAVGTLKGAGYSVSVSEVFSASKASGIVIGQRPGGGSALDPGESVAIVVSSSRATDLVKMPQIVGLTQSAAEAKVKDAGLVPYITYGNSGVPSGEVISQWPRAGDSLPVGGEGFIQVQLNP